MSPSPTDEFYQATVKAVRTLQAMPEHTVGPAARRLLAALDAVAPEPIPPTERVNWLDVVVNQRTLATHPHAPVYAMGYPPGAGVLWYFDENAEGLSPIHSPSIGWNGSQTVEVLPKVPPFTPVRKVQRDREPPSDAGFIVEAQPPTPSAPDRVARLYSDGDPNLTADDLRALIVWASDTLAEAAQA